METNTVLFIIIYIALALLIFKIEKAESSVHWIKARIVEIAKYLPGTADKKKHTECDETTNSLLDKNHQLAKSNIDKQYRINHLRTIVDRVKAEADRRGDILAHARRQLNNQSYDMRVNQAQLDAQAGLIKKLEKDIKGRDHQINNLKTLLSGAEKSIEEIEQQTYKQTGTFTVVDSPETQEYIKKLLAEKAEHAKKFIIEHGDLQPGITISQKTGTQKTCECPTCKGQGELPLGPEAVMSMCLDCEGLGVLYVVNVGGLGEMKYKRSAFKRIKDRQVALITTDSIEAQAENLAEVKADIGKHVKKCHTALRRAHSVLLKTDSKILTKSEYMLKDDILELLKLQNYYVAKSKAVQEKEVAKTDTPASLTEIDKKYEQSIQVLMLVRNYLRGKEDLTAAEQKIAVETKHVLSDYIGKACKFVEPVQKKAEINTTVKTEIDKSLKGATGSPREQFEIKATFEEPKPDAPDILDSIKAVFQEPKPDAPKPKKRPTFEDEDEDDYGWE